ncbi:MAG: hypothetical protein M1822_009257 [Bathelium mastoideum]|nr:MAG: hypothetical protein M1822_009257 [Bathelium mastoideum]
MEAIEIYPFMLGAGLLASSILYALGLAIYRIHFHPLSKFPGPKHYAVSEAFYSYENNWKGKFLKKALDLHQKYGDIVRIGPEHLAIDVGVAWPEVYAHTGKDHKEFGKDRRFFRTEEEGEDFSLIASTREVHRRQRRVLAHAFSDTALQEQQPLIMRYVDLLVQQLGQRAEAQEAVDLIHFYNYTTFDIIGDLAFGEPFFCLSNSDYHPWVSAIFANVRAVSQSRFVKQIPPLGTILKLARMGKDLQARKDHLTFTKEKTECRLAQGPSPGGRKDFMHYILRHNDEKGMSHTEILHNADTLIIAGSETTATTLSAVTYFLTTNPQAFQRLKDEIRTTFSKDEEITMQTTARLPYLLACLSEALRIYPAAAEVPPRISPGEYLRGVFLPPGINLSVYLWAGFHNPAHFKRPEQYIPERFLPRDHPYYDPLFDSDHKLVYQPFSFGPRNCIGKNLAWAELRLVLSKLLFHFDYEIQAESLNWSKDNRAFIVWEKPALMAKLRRVERRE